MDLTMSMFATQADYWKARAYLAEATVRETAAALNCKPDNEVMLAASQDATCYRWLSDTKRLYLGPVVGARRDNRGERHILAAVNLGCAPSGISTLDAAVKYEMAKRR